MSDYFLRPTRVICSVSSFQGLPELVESLIQLIPEITFYCTSGTLAQLKQKVANKYHSHLVDIYRYISPSAHSRDIVKTLDWRIFLGLLANPASASHQQALQESDALLFDMVIVNLYRKMIDIGGPALLRAAAKNWRRVIALNSPRQYPLLLSELRHNNGKCSIALRRSFAQQVFRGSIRYNRYCLKLIKTN